MYKSICDFISIKRIVARNRVIYGTFQCLKSNRFLIKSLFPLGTYILMKIYIKDNCVSQILITVVVHSIGEERVP